MSCFIGRYVDALEDVFNLKVPKDNFNKNLNTDTFKLRAAAVRKSMNFESNIGDLLNDMFTLYKLDGVILPEEKEAFRMTLMISLIARRDGDWCWCKDLGEKLFRMIEKYIYLKYEKEFNTYICNLK